MYYKRKLYPGVGGPTNPFLPPAPTPTEDFIESSEGVVLDVIVNEEHEFFAKDGYNVGCVRVRSMRSDFYRNEGELDWAFPVDANMEEWPLKNEVVRVFQIMNRIY